MLLGTDNYVICIPHRTNKDDFMYVGEYINFDIPVLTKKAWQISYYQKEHAIESCKRWTAVTRVTMDSGNLKDYDLEKSFVCRIVLEPI